MAFCVICDQFMNIDTFYIESHFMSSNRYSKTRDACTCFKQDIISLQTQK